MSTLRRGSSLIPSQSETITREEYNKKVGELDGEIKARHFLQSEFDKRLRKIENSGVGDGAVSQAQIAHMKNQIERQAQLYADLSRMHQDELAKTTQLYAELSQMKQEHARDKQELTQIQLLHGEITQVKADVANASKALPHIAQLQGELQQVVSQTAHGVGEMAAVRQESARLQQESARLHQEFARLQQDNAQTSAKFGEIGALSQEVARVKNEIQAIHAESTRASANSTQLAQLQNELGALKQELSHTSQLKHEVSTMKSEIGKASQTHAEVQHMKGEMKRHGEVHHEVQQLKGELKRHGEVHQQVQQLKGDLKRHDDVHKEVQNLKGEMKRHGEVHKEVASVKQELTKVMEAKEKLKGDSLKQKQQVEKEIGEIKHNDFANLKQQIIKVTERGSHAQRSVDELYNTLKDLGVLKPPVVEVAEDAPPPVGAIELADDCFSARTLINVSYLKARLVKHREELEFSSSEESFESMHDTLDNVGGIVPPEIEEGAKGFLQVTWGWAVMCSVILAFQIMIVVILVSFFLAPQECFAEVPSIATVYILRTSKCCAMIVTGALMIRDVMDIVNVLMVDVLLLDELNFLSVCTQASRLLLSCMIFVANVFAFRGYVNPTNVWVNMTALTFVAELGAATNDLARRGVFGHYIRSTLTSQNYTLTFNVDYPWWIPSAQQFVKVAIALLTASCSVYLLTADDPMCIPE
jgi:DNA repair exonuclease SbcCD ATPase subunit